MAITTDNPGLLGLFGRIAGVTAFVWLLPPFGVLSSLLPQEEPQLPGTLVIVMVILLVCAHIFLFNRAFYALKSSGIFVFTIVFLLLAYLAMALFQIGVSADNAKWYAAAYLSMLYSYGLCYNFVDAFLSGLLHTRSV